MARASIEQLQKDLKLYERHYQDALNIQRKCELKIHAIKAVIEDRLQAKLETGIEVKK
tara:strand:+ start:3855 stop:4028 length:174 start_codon:yes stop_codon:yes gene_type:complete